MAIFKADKALCGIWNFGHCDLFAPALVRHARFIPISFILHGLDASNSSGVKSVWARDLLFEICDFDLHPPCVLTPVP
jgi:hypothetical protein